jgi:gliding motility-associated-like protein
MTLLRRNCLVVLLFLLSATGVKATHIVGGEIYYDCLGNNNYKITLKVYRDCINGLAPFDDPASIGVFDGVTGNLIQNITTGSPAIVSISSFISVPCYAPSPGSVCEEEATYVVFTTLPPFANGYLLVYQRCCRNNTIVNLVNPGAQGSTLTTYVPPPSLATCNSSARFNYYPPMYLCQGLPFIVDHSATDPDGDSLVYDLCAPNNGADQLTPMPQPPNPPPYVSVTYQAPYNSSNQMSASPALTINPNSGILTGTPTLMGTWVVAVCCKEYRNGQLINVNMRDFQFNVVTCQPIPVIGQISANINAQTTNCTGLTIHFTQSSQNATNYYWNFGDPSTTSDTSNIPAPSYTYPTTGNYWVVLIANPGSGCADTDSVQILVTIPPTVQFPPPNPQCIIGNSFNFTAQGTYGPGASINWNFGSHANPSTSNLPDPQNIIFDSSGMFPVTITISENGCTATYTDSVLVYPVPQALFTATPLSGCVPYTVQFSDSSIVGTPATYLWQFGDGGSSTLANPVHTYTAAGTYDVMLIVTTVSGCIGIDTFFVPSMVTVLPIPTAGFMVSDSSVSIFDPFIGVTDESLNADSCYMDFGDGFVTSDCNSVHTYWAYGNYTIMQVVYNQFGCTDTMRIPVEVLPENRFFIPNTFTPNGNGLNDIFMPSIMGVENYRFMIFDRWGNLIFNTDDTFQGWDGRYKGNKCEEDVYVWKIEYTNVVTLEQEVIIGHVNLIR